MLSKVGRVIEIFSHSKFWISFIVSNSFFKYSRCTLFFSLSFSCNFLNIMATLEPDRAIRQPSGSGSGDDDGIEFIRCVGGKQPKIHEVWRLETTELRPKSIPQRELTSALSLATVLRPITLLEIGVRCHCSEENQLMKVFNEWAILTFSGTMHLLGLSISWRLVLIGGAEVPVPIRTWVVVLEVTPTIFISIGIGLFATFQFTISGSLKTQAALGATPVTVSSERTICIACTTPSHVKTASTVACWTGRMKPLIIAGISLFSNN